MKAILILLLTSAVAFGQKTAFWETNFYFEDGLGNKDSITLGRDIDADRKFNPDFGEVNLKDVPWDSVFEARASHGEAANGHAFPRVLSKKIIGTGYEFNQDENCLLTYEPLKIFVKVKHFPLKISWNSEDFEDYCSVYSYMSQFSLSDISENSYWFTDTITFTPDDYTCLSKQNETVFEYFSGKYFKSFVLEQNSSGGLDTIYGLYLGLLPEVTKISPCAPKENWGTVSVDDTQSQVVINLYPNPASHEINLEYPESLSWQLYDNQGQMLKNGKEHQIDIANLPNGVYILRLKIQNRVVVKKIVKCG